MLLWPKTLCGKALTICAIWLISVLIFALWWFYDGAQDLVPAWVVAIFITFWLGNWTVELFILVMRDIYMGVKKDAGPRFPPWLSGLFERAIFFAMMCYLLMRQEPELSGVPTIIGGWLALRLALNWQTRLANAQHKEDRARFSGGAQVAFWATILSISSAIFGAALAAGKITPN